VEEGLSSGKEKGLVEEGLGSRRGWNRGVGVVEVGEE
jgi:hypothetical protein